MVTGQPFFSRLLDPVQGGLVHLLPSGWSFLGWVSGLGFRVLGLWSRVSGFEGSRFWAEFSCDNGSGTYSLSYFL